MSPILRVRYATNSAAFFNTANLLVFLQRFKTVALKLVRKLYTHLAQNGPIEISEALCQVGFSKEMIQLLLESDCEASAELIQRYKDAGIEVVTIFDADYPSMLTSLDDLPVVLYVKGPIGLLHKRSISIVGSRHADKKGIDTAQQFSKVFSSNGLVVVSGLALGIDAASHIGALQSAAPQTVAVLANGVDHCYPSRHQWLYEQILQKGGAIVSEYPPGSHPRKENFLERNRIVAGLSELLLVVQAAKRSGTVRTASAALEYGREIAAVPWDITNQKGEGSNRLLRMGAHVILSPEDILSLFNIDFSSPKAVRGEALSEDQQRVLRYLHEHYEVYIDDLKREIPIGDVELVALELQGIIRRSPGDFITACRG